MPRRGAVTGFYRDPKTNALIAHKIKEENPLTLEERIKLLEYKVDELEKTSVGYQLPTC